VSNSFIGVGLIAVAWVWNGGLSVSWWCDGGYGFGMVVCRCHGGASGGVGYAFGVLEGSLTRFGGFRLAAGAGRCNQGGSRV
jgi:hypothetical protein